MVHLQVHSVNMHGSLLRFLLVLRKYFCVLYLQDVYKRQLRAQTIIKGLEKRNMEGVFCETKEDALAKALSYIEEGSSVTWGGSMSISEIGLMDAVKNGNYEIIDRSVAKNYDEQREIFSKAVLADYYLMSSNAITLDGELINIDGTGNRVACLTYGPKNVIMIVGMNKVVNDVEDGIKRRCV